MFLSPDSYKNIINNGSSPSSLNRPEPILTHSSITKMSDKEMIFKTCEILVTLRRTLPNLLGIFLLKSDATDTRLESTWDKRHEVFYKVINTYVPQHPVHHDILGQHMKVKRCPTNIQKAATKDLTQEFSILQINLLKQLLPSIKVRVLCIKQCANNIYLELEHPMAGLKPKKSLICLNGFHERYEGKMLVDTISNSRMIGIRTKIGNNDAIYYDYIHTPDQVVYCSFNYNIDDEKCITHIILNEKKLENYQNHNNPIPNKTYDQTLIQYPNAHHQHIDLLYNKSISSMELKNIIKKLNSSYKANIIKSIMKNENLKIIVKNLYQKIGIEEVDNAFTSAMQMISKAFSPQMTTLQMNEKQDNNHCQKLALNPSNNFMQLAINCYLQKNDNSC